jgi:hypothetical protein
MGSLFIKRNMYLIWFYLIKLRNISTLSMTISLSLNVGVNVSETIPKCTYYLTFTWIEEILREIVAKVNCLQDDILKKKNWYFMFGSGICGKHTSRDNKITRTESRCIYLKMFFFLYITYDVCILFDECPYVSKYSLSYDFSKDFV